MPNYQRGKMASAIKRLQLQLNIRLKPSPKLKPDGFFGPKTEAAVRQFQQQNKLPVTGILDDKTSWAIAHPMPAAAPPPNLDKFVKELGTADDFVQHVASREAALKLRAELLADLSKFFQTSSGRRYLLVEGDGAVVIDFRHFFASMAESYNSTMSRQAFGVALGGNPGQTVLLGVTNEISQCMSEAVAMKMNSCFSREDLGSNRLGAAFGELLRRRESENSRLLVSQHLRSYLNSLKPVPPEQVDKMKAPGGWRTVMETMAALASGLGDILVPRAY